MINSVYLLSKNRNLIKCFLNYDGVCNLFNLKELSTSILQFDHKSFSRDERIFVVIDDVGSREDHLQILKQLRKYGKQCTIAIMYHASILEQRIVSELKTFPFYKIATQSLDFFTFINWMQNLECNKGEYLDKEIQRHLHHFEISMKVLGFRYLKDAVLLKVKESKMKLMDICDRIARENNTTSSRVERCMRTALCNTNQQKVCAFIGLSMPTKISCMDFIVLLSNHIISDHKE